MKSLDEVALEALAELIDKAEDLRIIDVLDEFVHDMKDQEACEINNAGTLAQIEFIYQTSGETVAGVLEVLASLNVKV